MPVANMKSGIGDIIHGLPFCGMQITDQWRQAHSVERQGACTQIARWTSAGMTNSKFASRIVIAISVAGLIAICVYVSNYFLLAFAGVLGAIIIDAFAEWLSSHTRLKRAQASLIVFLAAIGVVFLAAWFTVPRVVVQLSQLTQALPNALKHAEDYLNKYDWGRIIVAEVTRRYGGGINFGFIAGELETIVKVVIGILVAVTITVVLTAYLGEDPEFYKKGSLAFLPPHWRPSADALFKDVTITLRRWLLGQAFTMTVLGVATLIGLLLLNIPVAFSLSLFTGAMIFIPFAGAIIAFIVVELVTLSFNPGEFLIVGILFIGIHVAEGYILTPLVQKKAVYLPPVLTILSEVFMSALFGFLGLVLATPLAAALRVVVERLWIEPQNRGELSHN